MEPSSRAEYTRSSVIKPSVNVLSRSLFERARSALKEVFTSKSLWLGTKGSSLGYLKFEISNFLKHSDIENQLLVFSLSVSVL